MIIRSFWDHVPLWPFALWPMLATALITNLWYFNRALERRQGIYYYDLYKGTILQSIYLPKYLASLIFVPLLFLYSCTIMGRGYFVLSFTAFPVLSVFVYLIVGFLPYSHFVTPLIYVYTVIAYATLLGWPHVEFIERFNMLIIHTISYYI